MAKGDSVKLAPVDWRVDAFDPSVEGAPVIKKGGVEVPADKVDEVKKQAEASGVELKEVSE